MDQEAYKKYNKPETGAQIGIYKHPNTEAELWCTSFPQADAVVRQGWVYDRPLPPKEELRKRGLLPADEQPLGDVDAKKAGEDADEVKRLRAELKEEKEARENKAGAERQQSVAHQPTANQNIRKDGK